jgi:hypothetical protein
MPLALQAQPVLDVGIVVHGYHQGAEGRTAALIGDGLGRKERAAVVQHVTLPRA